MAQPLPRVSEVTKRVLLLIVENRHSEFYGRDLAKRSGLQFGTVYGILDRLEKYGWLVGDWEEARVSKLSRPQRRYYRLTNSGFNLAQRTLNGSSNIFLDPLAARSVNRFKNSNSVRIKYREDAAEFFDSYRIGTSKYDIEVNPNAPVDIIFPFEAPVELGAKVPWEIFHITINGVDHTENYKLQAKRHVNDLVNGKTFYTSVLTVPSTVSGSSRSMQIEISAKINGESIYPRVAAKTYYQVDSYKLELSTADGGVFPEPKSVDAQDVGSVVWVRVGEISGPIDLNETDYASNSVVASKDKFVWETNKLKLCHLYQFSTKLFALG